MAPTYVRASCLAGWGSAIACITFRTSCPVSNAPRILFADEPTGNLDTDTGGRIVELLESLNRESNTTVVLVTHDLSLAGRAQRIIRLSDGAVVADTLSERAA